MFSVEDELKEKIDQLQSELKAAREEVEAMAHELAVVASENAKLKAKCEKLKAALLKIEQGAPEDPENYKSIHFPHQMIIDVRAALKEAEMEQEYKQALAESEGE